MNKKTYDKIDQLYNDPKLPSWLFWLSMSAEKISDKEVVSYFEKNNIRHFVRC